MHSLRSTFSEKFEETLKAVLPILLIVLLLCFSIAPIPPSILMTFLTGAAMLIAGMLFFNVGVDLSMTPMGERVGTIMTKSKNLIIIVLISFIMGFVITVSEPDLQVLAQQVPSIPNLTLILAVAAGVGSFLVIALLRMLFGIALPKLLVVFYLIIFALTPLVPADFLAVAFDSGGVTTGPITVPFIMALGLGLSSIRGDKTSAEDSFGLVAMCSIGPIITVLILGALNGAQTADQTLTPAGSYESVSECFMEFIKAFPHYMGEVASALVPIIVFFLIFNVISLKLDKKTLIKIFVGLGFTYIGLVLFLTGANVGFMPIGQYLGESLAGSGYSWILIPIGMLIGYFIVSAEPAVHVLKQQVETITEGRISAKALGMSLALGVAASVGIAMLRCITGVSILWFLIPGYALALIISCIVPPIFTSVAFDAGGVASGPLTATFLLPLAMGACSASGGNIAEDAFGIVAMVAMTPLLTIQILGLISKFKAAPVSKTAVPGVFPIVLSADCDKAVWLDKGKDGAL